MLCVLLFTPISSNQCHVHAEKTPISRRLMDKTCHLIGVVGAGDQQEDPGEGVLGGVGNLPGLGAWMKVEKENYFLFKSICSILMITFWPDIKSKHTDQ